MNEDAIVLGWVRDHKGNVIKRHPVEVANCVTAGKRENTQNYVVEQLTSIRGQNMQHSELEPQVLTPKRTEEGKRLRKDYESGKIKKQRKEMQELEPRTDGVTNTLTTAQKDNYVAIPANTKEGVIECEVGGVIDISYPSSSTRRGRVQDGGTDSPAVTCGVEHTHARIEEKTIKFNGAEFHEGDGLYTGASEAFQRNGLEGMSRCLKAGLNDAGCEQNYRIRKLTERECFRLMDVKDEDSDKIRAAVSKSQCYKLAGNSIVVANLFYIFEQLFMGNKNRIQQLELF